MRNVEIYTDGIIKLHERLFAAHEKALVIANQCLEKKVTFYGGDRTIDVFVDFSKDQPKYALKGYFMFRCMVFRFLSITFDYALLLPFRNHVKDGASHKGIAMSDIEEMLRVRVPLCFSIIYTDGKRLPHAIMVKGLDAHSPIYPMQGPFKAVTDDVGMPFTTFGDMKELAIVDIPEPFLSAKYTLVGKTYYAPYTREAFDCVLFAMTDNEFDSKAIKVLRRFKKLWDFQKSGMLNDTQEGNDFFELGFISRNENSALHDFMITNNCRILFANGQGDAITLKPYQKLFSFWSQRYPSCLLKYPVI